jgi:hypothetical protein
MKQQSLKQSGGFLKPLLKHPTGKSGPDFSGKTVLLLLFLTILLPQCKKVSNSDTLQSAAADDKLATKAVSGDEFTIAVIPDSQYETANEYGGLQAMFQSEITWIKNNRTTENIAYVIGLGDISDHGDRPSSGTFNIETEWTNASSNGGYYSLETPITTPVNLPNGIPYGLAVGNHDQWPTEYPLSSTTTHYNTKFGVSRFTGRGYYGGHYSSDNDSHYDLFTAGGKNFIAIYIEYDKFNENWTAMNTWAYNLLGTYSTYKAIIVSHFIIGINGTAGTNMGTPADFGGQGQAIYDRLKSRPNVFLMLCGHIGENGEGYRQDTYNGHTIKTYMSDYQGRFSSGTTTDGGGGRMRTMKFSFANDKISVKTFSPYTGASETDADSQFDRAFLHESNIVRTNDYNNNGKSELALYTPSTGVWHTYGNADVTWGQPGDIPIPGDYDGDGKTDVAIWRPSDFTWHISTATDITYGAAGDIPVPADYDGDGKTDAALFRPSTFDWYIKTAANTNWGAAGDIPVPADYDGDGKADVAIWRPSTFQWYVQGSTTVTYGATGDIPVPGDYDGDGKTDRALYRPSTGQWYTNGAVTTIVFGGAAGDIPMPGDYFGDGKTHQAYYRPSTHTLYMNNNGTTTSVVLGSSGDKVLNLPYHIRKFFFP